MKILRQWLIWGVLELMVCLIGMAYAPVLINSTVPALGFLIWLGVAGVLSGSIIYVLSQLLTAQKARQLFVQRFPEYKHLRSVDFLGVSVQQVRQDLETFEAACTDPDFQLLQLSPLDLLRRYQ